MKSEPIKLGYALIFIGILILVIKLNSENVKNSSDVLFVKGHFLDYTFRNGFRGSYDYTFKVKEFGNPFQIKADFAGIFQSEEFKKLGKDEELTFAIFRDNKPYLNVKDCKIFVYSIKSQETVFLDLERTIDINNSKTIYYIITLVILLGLIIIIYTYWQKQKKRWGKRIKLLKFL